jgi:hypothetical protein
MTESAVNQSRLPDETRAGLPSGGGGRWGDIIELVMADHRRIRRLGGALQDAARANGTCRPDWMLAHVWQRFAGLLAAHFRAEEEICYLPMFGPGPQAAGQRREAVADHDDIREAVGEAGFQRVGSALWWRPVRYALAASAAHLDREEDGVLAGCLPRLTMNDRQALGRQWSVFTAAWAQDFTHRTRQGVPPAR